MLNKLLFLLIVGLCAISISLHFAVESRAGGLEGTSNGLSQMTFDSHAEDHFTLLQPEQPVPAERASQYPAPAAPRAMLHPLAPLLEPPK